MSGEEDLKNKTFKAMKSRAQSSMAPEINSPFFIVQIIGLSMLEFSGQEQNHRNFLFQKIHELLILYLQSGHFNKSLASVSDVNSLPHFSHFT